MSGAGIVIGLVIYITFFAKSESLRSLGKLSIVPNIFNINEPIIFGTPIVLNIYLLVPFVLVPLIIGISSYLLMYFGILPLFSGVMVPWTTPPIISGFLIGGWKVALWQLVMITIVSNTTIWTKCDIDEFCMRSFSNDFNSLIIIISTCEPFNLIICNL